MTCPNQLCIPSPTYPPTSTTTTTVPPTDPPDTADTGSNIGGPFLAGALLLVLGAAILRKGGNRHDV